MISSSTPSFGSPSFKLVVKGLLELHRLIKEGKDDSPEAELVRDALDAPLSALSRADYERSRWLSEDLYSVSEPDDSTPREMNPQAQKHFAEAFEARQRRQWDRALELLRRWKAYIAPAVLSSLRGSIWLEAGYPEVAAVFYGHAAQCDAENPTYHAAHLHALAESDLATAERLANSILAKDQEYAPVVVAMAANIRADEARHVSVAERARVFRDLLPVLERNLSRIKKGEDESRGSPEYELTVVNLGLCHQFLGNMSAAVDCFSKGLRENPNNDGLLVARGIALYGKSQHAIGDLERAVSLESPVVRPYFLLAHHYLATGRYERCRAMCETALGMNASDTAKSQLEAWRAIALAELGFPPQTVRAAFEEALRLDPSNEAARHNQDVFEATLKGEPVHPPSRWEQIPDATIRSIGLAEGRLSQTASALLLCAE